MKLYQPSTIKELRNIFGFQFTKSLGQNFLIDKNTIDRIVEGVGTDLETLVLEIGPGIGVITGELAEDACKVVAIEIDQDLIPILAFTLKDCPNVEVVNQDVLKTDLNKLVKDKIDELKQIDSEIGLNRGYKVKIVGNLPYYITTPIIMKIFEEGVNAESITVMMQKEVADRIKAGPGTKAYGTLGLTVQYYAEVEKIVDVPRTCFMPNPKVDSTVIKLKPYKEKPVKCQSEEYLFKVIKASFNQRRKTLTNSLMGVEGITKEIVKESLSEAGIDPIRRGETLTLTEFADLSDIIFEKMKG